MRKLMVGLAGAALVGFLAAPAMANHDGIHLSGPHYNLNIIGVEKGKNSDMTGGNAHRIFVKLGSKGTTKNSKIYLSPADHFRVCDGNATAIDDGAWDCDGNLLANSGAVFQLPCNTNITDDQEELIECNEQVDGIGRTDLPTLHYAVYARALGSPKNNPFATIKTCATVQGDDLCSTENTVQTRNKGKSPWEEVTDELTSIVVQYCFGGAGSLATCVADGGVIKTTRIALFSGDTEDWFWNYDNNGLRLLQLRFYEIPTV